MDGLPEGRPFDQLYAEAGVPASPYPAERLLRLLDGLKAMEPAVRKAAVLAMDAADESWTLQDSILDAERKIRALEALCAQLDEVVSSTEASATEALALQEARAAEASERIRAQIAEMEALLATELQAVADDRSAIRRELDAVRGARERERSRLMAEMQRLRSLYPLFRDPDAEQ
ncbi:MAG TPA: methyl-accepting chemotaxis protein [Deltaproteobacteria bacterium]|nr:methyl-accepting chemotaxis protein [Deltaproteobacteria bacterium]